MIRKCAWSPVTVIIVLIWRKKKESKISPCFSMLASNHEVDLDCFCSDPSFLKLSNSGITGMYHWVNLSLLL